MYPVGEDSVFLYLFRDKWWLLSDADKEKSVNNIKHTVIK